MKLYVIGVIALLTAACSAPTEIPANESDNSTGASLESEPQAPPAPNSGPYLIQVGPASGQGPWRLFLARDGGRQLNVHPFIIDPTFDDGEMRGAGLLDATTGRGINVMYGRENGVTRVLQQQAFDLANSDIDLSAHPYDGTAFADGVYAVDSVRRIGTCTFAGETGTLWTAHYTEAEVDPQACITRDGITMGEESPELAAFLQKHGQIFRIVRGPIDPSVFDPARIAITAGAE
jgi:hypothetical protein